MRLVFLIPAGFAIIVAAPALAEPKDTEADWLKRPTAQDLAAVWPTDAFRRGQGGRAKIGCAVTVQGTLRDCKVVEESPPGAGFGGAALALVPQFLMKPATKAGRPVESSVVIPINFATPDISTGSHLRGPGIRDAPAAKVLTGVRWIEAPSVAEVRAAYPEKARAARLTGRATLDCVFNREGRLGGCSTLTEEPDGAGFSAAAKKLVGRFLGPTVVGEGQSTLGVHAHLAFTFAPELLDPNPLIGKPDWMALPQPDDMAAAFPEAARKAGALKARVVLSCRVGPQGGLSDCATVSEEPAALGYAEATRALTRSFRLGVWSAEGLPTVGGTVRVPLRFDFTDAEPPPAAKK